MDVDQDSQPSTSRSVVSPNTKQRQSMDIRKKYHVASIRHAAMMVQEDDSARKIHKMLIDDPANAKKLLDGLSASSNVTKLSNFEALAFMIHNNLTVDHYKIIKSKSDECNASFLPCYSYINQEKVNCRPPKETITVTETEAMAPLKEVSVHTVDRIFKIPEVAAQISKAKEASENKDNFKVKATIKIGNDT